MRTPFHLVSLVAVAGVLPLAAQQTPPPNIVVIFIDDMGYADIGPFGGTIPTPNLDRMAKEGRRFTDFAVSSPVCSASRAALLTGCYHRRVGINGPWLSYGEHAGSAGPLREGKGIRPADRLQPDDARLK